MKYKGVKMMKNEMKLSMDAISENEALGRICIATFLTRLHPTLEELEDVKTAVSEAITNAIIHGDAKKISFMWRLRITASVSLIFQRRWNHYIQQSRSRSDPVWDLPLWKRLWMN